MIKKIRHLFLILILPSISCIAEAQLVIDGKAVAYDSLTNTMFATISEAHFGQTAELSIILSDGCTACTIDSLAIGNSHTFCDIDAEQCYEVTLTADDGHTIQRHLQFTFLPIIQLKGEFGYDYQQGTFLFSHPDSSHTDTLTARIKWRGGTTNANNKHKRNYKINFDEDHRFFGFRNDDKWMLDAGQPDVFRMRNRIAMDLWNKMARQPYYADKEPKALNGVRGQIVELFLGNEWRGIYNFSEFIDRKQLKLKKTDSKTGEIRGCLYKGFSWDKTRMFDFLDSYDNTKDTLFGYEVKYPDLEDSDTVDWAPLVEANNFALSSTDEDFQQHIDDYFDMPVVIDYNIFFNVVNAVDNAGKNMYWAIYDKTETKCLTPAPWDLDATFGQRWGGQLISETEEGFYNSPEFKLDFELMLTYRLFRDNFNDYIGQLNERYKQLRQPGQPLHTDSILTLVDRYYQAVKNSGAASREEAKWSGDSDVWGDVIDFDTEYAYICDWIRQRMPFIDHTELPLYYKESYFEQIEGIQSPQLTNSFGGDLHSQTPIYNLSGRTGIIKPGLYIRGGRKVIVK